MVPPGTRISNIAQLLVRVIFDHCSLSTSTLLFLVIVNPPHGLFVLLPSSQATCLRTGRQQHRAAGRPDRALQLGCSLRVGRSVCTCVRSIFADDKQNEDLANFHSCTFTAGRRVGTGRTNT
ncbi:hypothetical protein FHG87_003513 [Trinorchestia longiramus]|nr:hypothetical protein FHG87_003513 [Trinorchestia longiramus]